MEVSEKTWLTWKGDPADLVRFINPGAKSRKVRLFYCACVRQVWEKLTDLRSRHAVQQSELFADCGIDQDELLQAKREGYQAWYDIASRSLHSEEDRAAAAAFMCANLDVESAYGVLWSAAVASGNESAGYASQVILLHEIFGNPFRPAIRSSDWLSSTVLSLAEGIDLDRAYDRLPILADALQDTGCQQLAILEHCRSDRQHVRGCWVVDLLLGKH